MFVGPRSGVADHICGGLDGARSGPRARRLCAVARRLQPRDRGLELQPGRLRVRSVAANRGGRATIRRECGGQPHAEHRRTFCQHRRGPGYVLGHLDGLVFGQFREASRSGLADPVVRLAINLFGAPAMTRQQFAASRPQQFSASASSWHPTRSVRPQPVRQHRHEPMVDQARSRFFTQAGPVDVRGRPRSGILHRQHQFLNGGTRHQSPIAAAQAHLTYTVPAGPVGGGRRQRLDGGRVTVNGVEQEKQRNSRLGITLAVPVGRQQMRVAYSFGAFTTIGGDFQSLGVSYSYAWAGRP